MSFRDQVAEALAGTQPIAIIGDDARDDLYKEATEWGFQLASLKAADLPSFGPDHPLWGKKSKASWLLVIEDAHQASGKLEDLLLDLAFDGCSALPGSTLIALHFGTETELSEALEDPAAPIATLRKTSRKIAITVAVRRGALATSNSIPAAALADRHGVQLAA